MIDNFSLIFFTLCIVVSIYQAVKLDRRKLADSNQKNEDQS